MSQAGKIKLHLFLRDIYIDRKSLKKNGGVINTKFKTAITAGAEKLTDF
jgi:hypothetical protein